MKIKLDFIQAQHVNNQNNYLNSPPLGVKWCFGDASYEIINSDGIAVAVLEKFNKIAIIEGIKTPISSKVYIIDYNKEIIWNVKGLVMEQTGFIIDNIYFVYAIDSFPYFLFNKSSIDY